VVSVFGWSAATHNPSLHWTAAAEHLLVIRMVVGAAAASERNYVMRRGDISVTLPAALTICNSAAAADGGSLALLAVDEHGKEHSVVLVQHAFAKFDTPPHSIPGRLYFDGEIVEVRSTTEGALLELLRNADVRLNDEERRHGVAGGPEEARRATVQAIVDFVASVHYVAFAAITDEMRKRLQ
jgi:hypothetical protein